ncbi:carboxypeptidase B-like [Ostrinia nubilalis]|uniref:carboxypeptidase B-like n=1 Tax=Ostrinia nubilalis TaxID=29057 RepID=UPI0030826945
MKVLAIALLFVAVYAKHEEYAGYKSYFVGQKNQAQQHALQSLENEFQLDFLGRVTSSQETLVLVKPEFQAAFTKSLKAFGLSYRVHADDVVKALQNDDRIIEEVVQEKARNGGARIPYDNYQPLSVYDAYLDDIARRYPNVVTLVSPANSFEGRPIKYLKISTTNFQDTSKPVIFIDGGIHSREWISPPTVTWAIRKLVEDVTEPDLLERFDWILLPIVNPDGYEHSYTSNRFWRKTRSATSIALCRGVDGNRNYDFAWNTVGTSTNPCSDTYGGPTAFSEIETRVVRDILHENLSRMALYLTMHSFGSMILYPWGHDGSLSNNAFALQTVGVAMADEIFTHSLPNFPRYSVGNSLLTIGYGASGASEDYAHSIGVPLSYTYELPGLNAGMNGFILDPRFIEQVCRETWAGIVVGARRAGDLFVPHP